MLYEPNWGENSTNCLVCKLFVELPFLCLLIGRSTCPLLSNASNRWGSRHRKCKVSKRKRPGNCPPSQVFSFKNSANRRFNPNERGVVRWIRRHALQGSRAMVRWHWFGGFQNSDGSQMLISRLGWFWLFFPLQSYTLREKMPFLHSSSFYLFLNFLSGMNNADTRSPWLSEHIWSTASDK